MTESPFYGVVRYVTETVAFVTRDDSSLFAIHGPMVEPFPFSLIMSRFHPATTYPGDSVAVTDHWCQVGLSERSEFRWLSDADTKIPRQHAVPAEVSNLLNRYASEEPYGVELASDLEELLVSGAPEQLESLVASRIGNGQGLTPSTDDIVVGLASGFECIGGFPEYSAALSPALDSIPVGQTTDVSRALLLAAGTGRFPPALADLCRSLPRLESARGALRRVARIGGSSGREMITGLATVARASKSRLHSSRDRVLKGEL